MKVLLVHPQMAYYAGAEVVVVRLARYLQKHGHKTSILTLSTAPHTAYEGLDFILPEREDERMQYRLRGGLSSLRDIIQMFITLRYLCIIHANNFDVVNIHNFPAIWAAPRHKHTVWMCNEIPDLWHGSEANGLINQLFNTGRLVDRLVVRGKSPTAVVPDEKCAQRFQHRYGFQPEIIPYGIDGEFFAQTAGNSEVRQRYGINPSSFCIIQPSMVSPSKDQMSTLVAANYLKQSIPHLKVILSGYYEPSHPYTKQLKEYITVHNLDVVFVGPTSREELRALYHTAHVAVFPGKGQGSWLGPFEQLSVGTPVIVSPNLSCAELIRKERLGTVTTDMTNALLTIQNNYPKWQQQAFKGREFVLNNLTWDSFGEKMLELLER